MKAFPQILKVRRSSLSQARRQNDVIPSFTGLVQQGLRV